jgi:hypothetical protein
MDMPRDHRGERLNWSPLAWNKSEGVTVVAHPTDVWRAKMRREQKLVVLRSLASTRRRTARAAAGSWQKPLLMSG